MSGKHWRPHHKAWFSRALRGGLATSVWCEQIGRYASHVQVEAHEDTVGFVCPWCEGAVAVPRRDAEFQADSFSFRDPSPLSSSAD